MKKRRFQVRLRAGITSLAFAFIALASVIAVPWSDARAGNAPTYSIDFHLISSGGSPLHSSCFRMPGTLGQPAPGYSSGSTNSILAGFWAAATGVGEDEIFFNGLEGC